MPVNQVGGHLNNDEVKLSSSFYLGRISFQASRYLHPDVYTSSAVGEASKVKVYTILQYLHTQLTLYTECNTTNNVNNQYLSDVQNEYKI